MRCPLAFSLLAACAVPMHSVGFAPSPSAPAEIVEIVLKWSNVYLIKTAHPILIDSGSPGDEERLLEALAREHLTPKDLGLVVLTHCHADHAGNAKWLQSFGVRIAAGAGDLPLATAGHDDDLKPTNLTARLLRASIDFPYAPFTPDIVVDEPLALATYGIEGVIEPMPGHTLGSLIVVLSDAQAFVGDMMLGGYLGAFAFDVAGEHYYQADLQRNHRNIEALRARPIRRYYVGHGGPLTPESVGRAFPSK